MNNTSRYQYHDQDILAVEIPFFKNGIKSVTPSTYLSLNDALNFCKNGTYKHKIEEIHQVIENDSLRKVLKSNLDYFVFSATFNTKRKADDINQYLPFLVLDLDGVENLNDTKKLVCADEHTLFCFISPSGNGLKVGVLKANPQKHKETFEVARVHYENAYNISVDKSGSDPTRACFVSYDPTLFINQNATYFEPPNSPIELPEIHVESVNDTIRFTGNLSQELQKAQKYVTAIVQSDVDITETYNDWFYAANCLSALGEKGREMFHQLSRLHNAYKELETNQKFDNLLKTGRFTTLNKLYELAEKANISIEQKRFKRETVRYHKDRTIEIKTKKNGFETVAEFHVFIKFKAEDENEEITWHLELHKPNDEKIYIEVTHDELCSAKALKKIIASKCLSLRISDQQLDELHEFLFQSNFPIAAKITRYGWQKDSQTFCFSNKVLFQSEILSPDLFNILKAGDKYLSMPQVNSKKQLRFFLTESEISFNEWFRLFSEAHQWEYAFMPTCFYIMTLFRDIAISHQSFMPILYLKGSHGTGKSSIIRSLTALYGYYQDEVNLKSRNTSAALIKLLSQSVNVIQWFDEFENEQSYEGLLQAVYDLGGYHLTPENAKNNTVTTSVDIHSSLALTSNYTPANQIFFSRCLFLLVSNQQKTDNQRINYSKLKEIEKNGLGTITAELFRYRDLVYQNYSNAYGKLHRKLSSMLHLDNIPERHINNLAQTMAAAYILQVNGKIQICESTNENDILSDFCEFGKDIILKHHNVMADKTPLAEFFEILQLLFDSNAITDGTHYKFNGEFLEINRKVFTLFKQKYHHIYYKQSPDKDNIIEELIRFEEPRERKDIIKSVRFMTIDSNDSKSIPETGSLSITYSKVQKCFNIDFSKKQYPIKPFS